MLFKLPLALSLLLSASILAAAELAEVRTGDPYYLAPLNWALGGGVAPKRVGNDVCPSAVKLTSEVDHGLPITFTSPSHSEESVVIGKKTDVLISFNLTVCGKRTWANLFYISTPSTMPLVLVGNAVPTIYETTRFRLEKELFYYKLYSIKNVDGVLQHYNLVSYLDAEDNYMLGLSRKESPLQFVLYKEEDYNRMIKSAF